MQTYTRREMIMDCVKSYIKINPIEWQAFLKIMSDKRMNLADEKFAVINDDVKSDSISKMRHIFSVPQRLLNTIETILKLHDQPPFLKTKDEKLWFRKNFPKFTLASQTNIDSDEPET